MQRHEQRFLSGAAVLGLPAAFWLTAVKQTETLGQPAHKALIQVARETPEKPVLVGALGGGAIAAAVVVVLLHRMGTDGFAGAPYRRFLRGTRMVSSGRLKRMTREFRTQQVMVAGVPMPTEIENRHLLVNGSTGTGKSVLLRDLAFSAMQRGDKCVIVDPGGDMLSKFGKPNDVILNPYDERTQGWSFFNEIRADYDWQRYALSVVPRGSTADAENWANYGRLLLRETAKKLSMSGNPTVRQVYHWTSVASSEELHDFLKGTLAESLFAGSSEASRALTSARFVLSDKLPEHVTMPRGEFSIRSWLEDPEAGNLYITWREDMAVAMRPLISAWVDTVCTSVLSLTENLQRRLWLFIDELASMEKLPSLVDACTKGRKFGLRVVAGLQSTSQLDSIYGQEDAQTLRACFRSLVVLGGSRTDPKTNEDMSKSLGKHEVERVRRTRNAKGCMSSAPERVTEAVVSAAEIASLPDLHAYVAFAGDRPIAKVKMRYREFAQRITPFVETFA